jgi:hypothetical protein
VAFTPRALDWWHIAKGANRRREEGSMGVAIYVVLERKESDADSLAHHMAGKALAHEIDVLDPIAKQRGLKSLFELCSGDPTGGALDDGVDIPPEEWFDPRDGLRVVRGLLEILRAREVTLRDFSPEHVIFDLVNIETVLTIAEAEENRFHVALDI